MVGFTEDGERLVGQIAKRQAVTNPENTVYAVKRLIGRQDRPEVAKEKDSSRSSRRRRQRRRLGRDPRQEIRASEVSAFVLQKMKQTAEDYLGEHGDRSRHHGARVLQRRPAPGHQGRRQDRRPRRPAHHQRADRRRARLRPRQEEATGTIAVYDLGGGTFDISILELGDGVFEVQVDQRRHVPRRRRLRQAHRSTGSPTSSRRSTASTCARTAGAAAPEGGGREGEVRALVRDADRDQPAVHHGGRVRARSTST